MNLEIQTFNLWYCFSCTNDEGNTYLVMIPLDINDKLYKYRHTILTIPDHWKIDDKPSTRDDGMRYMLWGPTLKGNESHKVVELKYL